MLVAMTSILGQTVLDWHVKKLEFSAVSIGVAMQNDTTGWSSFTNGASSIKITKTTDGGATWNHVKNQTDALMIMGMDLSSSPALDVVTTGMLSTSFSTDGEVFKGGFGAPFISQSIKAMDGGRVVVAASGGVCTSTSSGARFICKKVPFKYGPQARYVSAPSSKVIYVTAGSWPSHTSSTRDEVQLTANLRLVNRSLALGSRQALEMGAVTTRPPSVTASATPNVGYTAELWKSTDGGDTWKSLISDEGNFYFNDIDCSSEDHCVAVGEGFGHDGSASPGARVYVTTDGDNFKLAHHETTDGSSLMAAKALSDTEHHVGGMGQGWVALHSTDAGKSYGKLGSKIRGQMITSMSFIKGSHAFATSISQLQICSLLEYGSA